MYDLQFWKNIGGYLENKNIRIDQKSGRSIGKKLCLEVYEGNKRQKEINSTEEKIRFEQYGKEVKVWRCKEIKMNFNGRNKILGKVNVGQCIIYEKRL